jgi:tetrahydromethanopterin S-methyltransferase subunit B
VKFNRHDSILHEINEIEEKLNKINDLADMESEAESVNQP